MYILIREPVKKRVKNSTLGSDQTPPPPTTERVEFFTFFLTGSHIQLRGSHQLLSFKVYTKYTSQN